jgi:DNA repair exonuclease SbcCD ATPase subunit
MIFPPTQEEIAEVRALAIDFRNKAAEAAKALDELRKYMNSRSLALSDAKQRIIEKPYIAIGSTFWRIQVQRYKLRFITKRSERVVDWERLQPENGS